MSDKPSPPAADADLSQIIASLETSAEQGNAEAQFRLGAIYGNGDGVELDHQRALAYFNQAARQGHENALITLAWMYANGTGVDVDEKRARELYLLAADHGSAKAQYVVGTMFRFAQYGVQQDVARALDYYTRAANQGLATAQFALGKLLLEGKLVERDDVTALQWLMLADSNGSKRAGEYIQLLMQRMSPEQRELARERITGGAG